MSSVRVDVCEVDDDTFTPVDSDGDELEADDDGEFTAYEEPAVTEVVEDTLQTDARWTKDSTAYNVAYKFEAPLRGKLYDVRVKLTMACGDTLVVPFAVVSRYAAGTGRRNTRPRPRTSSIC